MGSTTGSVIDYWCWEAGKLEGRKPAWTPPALLLLRKEGCGPVMIQGGGSIPTMVY